MSIEGFKVLFGVVEDVLEKKVVKVFIVECGFDNGFWLWVCIWFFGNVVFVDNLIECWV